MRNPALEPLDVLVGEWALTLTDAWFLDRTLGRIRGSRSTWRKDFDLLFDRATT